MLCLLFEWCVGGWWWIGVWIVLNEVVLLVRVDVWVCCDFGDLGGCVVCFCGFVICVLLCCFLCLMYCVGCVLYDVYWWLCFFLFLCLKEECCDCLYDFVLCLCVIDVVCWVVVVLLLYGVVGVWLVIVCFELCEVVVVVEVVVCYCG